MECVINISIFMTVRKEYFQENTSSKNFMISSFYSAGSGSIVQYSPAGGAKSTQITAKGSEVETSDGLSVHIVRWAQSGLA